MNAINPKHYTSHPSGIECIEITKHMDFLTGNAMKYLWRAGLKDDKVEDLEKAVWYLQKLIDKEKDIASKSNHKIKQDCSNCKHLKVSLKAKPCSSCFDTLLLDDGIRTIDYTKWEENDTEHKCSNCAHEKVVVNEKPCICCNGFTEWEEKDYEEVKSVDHNCYTCDWDNRSVDERPCLACYEYNKWMEIKRDNNNFRHRDDGDTTGGNSRDTEDTLPCLYRVRQWDNNSCCITGERCCGSKATCHSNDDSGAPSYRVRSAAVEKILSGS